MRLINPGQNPIGNMVDGYLELWSKKYRRVPIERGSHYGVMRRDCDRRVSIVVGSGSGNEPWCLGYVGDGLADAAVVGSIYTAPSARAIQTVTRNVPNKDGVVYICTNHAGDVLNFELAGELAELEGIDTRTIAVTDDAASAPIEERSFRRGTAGVLLVVKTAGGASSLDMNMEDVARIAAKANDNTYSFCAAASPLYDPETGKKLLDLEPGMIEYGVGLSGESGIMRKPFSGADEMTDTVIRSLLGEIQPLPMNEIAVLINRFGHTTDMELLQIVKRTQYVLRRNEIKISHILVGKAYAPIDSNGFSISIMCMDDELKRCFEQPAWSPLLQGFSRRDMEIGVHWL